MTSFEIALSLSQRVLESVVQLQYGSENKPREERYSRAHQSLRAAFQEKSEEEFVHLTFCSAQ
jgi:hypothetical protein